MEDLIKEAARRSARYLEDLKERSVAPLWSAPSHQGEVVRLGARVQFAFAYSLIAQIVIYIHEGHGQIVKSLEEIFKLLS